MALPLAPALAPAPALASEDFAPEDASFHFGPSGPAAAATCFCVALSSSARGVAPAVAAARGVSPLGAPAPTGGGAGSVEATAAPLRAACTDRSKPAHTPAMP